MKQVKSFIYFLSMVTLVIVTLGACKAFKDDIDDDYKMNRLEYIDGTQTTPSSISGTTWLGEFSGYEANAKRIFYVRRRVEYKSDGTYQIDYWGSEDKTKLSDSSNQMDQFEIETGTYTYSNGIVHYTCLEDRIVDYETYNLYNNDGQYKASETSEAIRTATTTKNKTAWIAKDNYLWAEVEDNSRIEYDMVKQ